MDDNRTMKDLARNALDAQGAVNLSGVIHSFSRDISRLRVLVSAAEGENFSNIGLNQHPVCRLYAEQIMFLTAAGSGDSESYHKSYEWCKKEILLGNVK